MKRRINRGALYIDLGSTESIEPDSNGAVRGMHMVDKVRIEDALPRGQGESGNDRS
jgi:hypothetical protein